MFIDESSLAPRILELFFSRLPMHDLHPWMTFGLLGVVLILAAIFDWRWGVIPNRLTLPAMLAGLLLAAAMGLSLRGGVGLAEGLLAALTGLLAGLIPMAVIFYAGGIGGGDVKIMAAFGALSASWQCVLSAAVYSFLVAAAIAVVLMVRHGIVIQTLQRLLMAAMALMGRRGAAGWWEQAATEGSPKVPFGVALCFGGLLAAAEHLLGLKLPWS